MKRLVAIAATLVLFATGCDIAGIILTPPRSSIVAGSTVPVSGTLPENLELGGTLRVNGVVTPVAGDRSWSTTVPKSPGYVTVIHAAYTDPNGIEWTEDRTVVNGTPLAEGQFSPNGVGMRFTDAGLAGLGPVIQGLAGSAFDIGGLLLSQNPIIDQDNAFLHFDITGNAYEAGLSSVNLTAESTSSGVATDISISGLFVGVKLNIRDGLAINTNCSLELTIPTTTIDATFDLRPSPSDASQVDVNLVGSPAVNTGTVGYEFISGICDGDTFLIGDIVNAFAGPEIQNLVGDAFSSQLGDPDGSGPADSPIADAIETALADISIAGSVGDAVQAQLDAPFTSITESSTAIDFRSNADFSTSIGTGAGQCQPPAGAPDLPSTYDVPGSYPSLGSTTPTGGTPYGLGLVISASAFNQLLGSMTECGLLNQDITTIDLGLGTPLPITSTLLAGIIPAFGTELPPNTPITIRLEPSFAPFISSQPGPNGEPAELVLADLQVKFVHAYQGGEFTRLQLALDAPLGFALDYDEVGGVLAPTITAPPVGDVTARVVVNGIDADEPSIEALFPGLFPTFVSGLGSSFAAFPLPSFLGLQLEVLEVARHANHFVLYSNLNPVPQTHIANVSITNLSSGNSATDSIFDVNEWRHRIRSKKSPTEVTVDFKGMVGADACCTTGDEERSAHAGYRVSFQVVPAPGETWRLDLSHLIRGAHTIIDEQGGSGATRFDSAIGGQVRVGSGSWQTFNFTPSVTSTNSGGNVHSPFTGSNSRVLTGTTTQTITIEFGFDVFARSESNLAFPAVAGDEAAIRFGANDTIANGFTAGEYPGVGNRNIVTDGHFATIRVTGIPS